MDLKIAAQLGVATDVSVSSANFRKRLRVWWVFATSRVDFYRPERYYMRGAGPKSRNKQRTQPSSSESCFG
jgi:hypothetical protein